MIALATKRKSEGQSNLAVMTPGGKVRNLTAERDPQFGWSPVAFVDNGTAIIANRSRVDSREGEVWKDTVADGKAVRLLGKADVVEFDGRGAPYPVEYKHGSRHKASDIAACDDLQLAGQALCLEAMTGLPVPAGAIYYASSKRRRIVSIDESGAGFQPPRPMMMARAVKMEAEPPVAPGEPLITATGLRDHELRWDQRLHFAVRGALVMSLAPCWMRRLEPMALG
jgi:hypothetical protein